MSDVEKAIDELIFGIQEKTKGFETYAEARQSLLRVVNEARIEELNVPVSLELHDLNAASEFNDGFRDAITQYENIKDRRIKQLSALPEATEGGLEEVQ